MQAAPGESSLRRPLVIVVLVAAVLAVATGVVLMLRGQGDTRASLPGGTSSSTGADRDADRDAAAMTLVQDWEEALTTNDPTAVEGLTDVGAAGDAAGLAAVADNLEALRLTSLSLRYVGESDAAEPAVSTVAERATWVADVELTWTLLPGTRPSSVSVPVRFSWDGRAAHLVEVLPGTPDGGGRTPVWFAGEADVVRSGRLVIISEPGATTGRLEAQARTALGTVARVVPGWRGSLVVEAPASTALFSAASGLPPEDASAIAAVTTTPDGDFSDVSTAQVYLNPDVYGPLAPGAQEIVLAHEATHVATDAIRTSMPLWLSEGFADYVALRDTPRPVSELAGQVLAEVSKDGPPPALPGPEDFDGSDESIGAAYEGAWLAVRLLGEQYGEERLLGFYAAADRSGDVARLFRTRFGTTERAFVAAWQRELVALARTAA